VENTFGMLVHRFRLFLRILDIDHQKAARLIYAAVILHNFLGPYELDDPDLYAPGNGNQQNNHPPGNTIEARNVRELFVTFLNS
jgi:hypothetical protein